jgi:mRNA interferase HicA
VGASEFLRAVERLGRKRGVDVRIESGRGKGSHRTVWFGCRRTILSYHGGGREVPPGTLRAMLRQLGLSPRDLEEG